MIGLRSLDLGKGVGNGGVPEQYSASLTHLHGLSALTKLTRWVGRVGREGAPDLGSAVSDLNLSVRRFGEKYVGFAEASRAQLLAPSIQFICLNGVFMHI